MKDLTARTNGVGTIFLDLEVNDLYATINMTSSMVDVAVFDEDGGEHDITSDVLVHWSDYKIDCLEDIDCLKEAMNEYNPPEPDYEAMAADRADHEQYEAEQRYP